VRAAAARAVHAVRGERQSLTAAIAAATAQFDERDAALLQAMSFGTLRLLPRLDALTAQLLSRPLQRGDRILQDLMAVGLYQLSAMRIPEHAAVAATVGAARTLGRPRAAGLINAMLRRFQRERPALLARIENDPGARWLFPDWLLMRLQDAWPEHWQAIVDACNEQPPMTLRVNRLRTSIRDYAKLLAGAGLAARPLPHLADALMLDSPLPTRSLPGFAEGLVSVQDSSAQLAATLLDPQDGEAILDACAAPGGKTAHLLEQRWHRHPGHGDRRRRRAAGDTATQPRATAPVRDSAGRRRARGASRLARCAVSAHPGRRTLFRNRRDPASSGHQVAASRYRHRRALRDAARHARRIMAAARAGRTHALRDLLGVTAGE
jgi:16S rRNA (cytosine(967)-C(5))-methyltransferase